MDSLPNLQFQTNTLLLLQMLPYNLQLTYVTPNAGRPQASRRAGNEKYKWGGKEKGMRMQFLKFPDWGVTIKNQGFPKSLKETLVCIM